jgi:hypothetical protein
VHACIENASNIKNASRIIVFFTLQMYDSRVAIDFKGNAKEGEEGQPQSGGAVLKFAPWALKLAI